LAFIKRCLPFAGRGAARRRPEKGLPKSSHDENPDEVYLAKAAQLLAGGEGFVIPAIDGAEASASSGKPAIEAQWIA
jgi:hypothetical protein